MKFHCKVCEHNWFPRSENKPKVCPKCGSEYWDRGRQRAPRSEQLATAPIKRINAAIELLASQGYELIGIDSEMHAILDRFAAALQMQGDNRVSQLVGQIVHAATEKSVEEI